MRCRGNLAFRTPSWTSLGCGVLVCRTEQWKGSGSIIHSFLANNVLTYNLTVFLFPFAVHHRYFPQLNHLTLFYMPVHSCLQHPLCRILSLQYPLLLAITYHNFLPSVRPAIFPKWRNTTKSLVRQHQTCQPPLLSLRNSRLQVSSPFWLVTSLGTSSFFFSSKILITHGIAYLHLLRTPRLRTRSYRPRRRHWLWRSIVNDESCHRPAYGRYE